MSDKLTASEMANLLTHLAGMGCTCASVQIHVDRETTLLEIGHDNECPLCPEARDGVNKSSVRL